MHRSDIISPPPALRFPLRSAPRLSVRTFVLLLLGLLIVVLGATAALSQPAAPPTLRFKQLGPLGNDEPSILSLLQDRQGFMWIGTHVNGLYRYNGYHAVRYTSRSNDPNSLPHDRVSALYEDRQGRIWAGTQNGLARYNPETNNFTVFRAELGPKNRGIIKAIISDGKDGMWIASWGGLQHFDPASGKFVVYAHDPALPGSLATNDVNAIALDAKGGVWAATWPGGLDYLPPGGKAFVHHAVDLAEKPDPRRNIVRALQFDKAGALWIGTESGALRWDPGTPWSARKVLVTPNSRVNSFYIDRQGTLWATTLSAGLLRWDARMERFSQFSHNPSDPFSLPGDNLRALAQDRGGMLWVASFTDGISLVNLNSVGFTRYVPHSADQTGTPGTNAVLSIARAPDNKLWLGGNVGLSLFDPASNKVVRRYVSDPSQPGTLTQNIVYCLYQDPEGPLWAGTSNGLNRLDQADGKFSSVHFGDTASDYINAIAPGRGGVLWLATGNSLIRYLPAAGTWKIYRNDPNDPDTRSVNGTSVVLEDRSGRVWMGSEWNGGGLDLLDPKTGKFQHFVQDTTVADGLADDNVSSLHEDSLGRIWVGTSKGLQQVILRDGKIGFRSYLDATHGAKILSIRNDLDDNLWVSTIAGLYRIEPATGKSLQYTAADGMTDGFTINSSAPGPNGLLYFGGVHGMTAIAPRDVRSPSVAPQVAITDIKVYNHSLSDARPQPGVKLEGAVTAPRRLTLSPPASGFSIEFAALHYTEPGLNRYAYRLEGFDADWVETDATRRAATYTNLDPGRYVFRVKAANHRGVWNEDPAALIVTVTPPFWQAWWFRTAAVVLAAAILWALYRWRVRRLTQLKAALERVVAQRTAELEQSNLKLAALSTTDGLTGITNRRGFDTQLATEWRRAARTGQPLALLVLDVDYFKKYNDRYGHVAGDACLRTVAELLTRHARRTTDLAARYGGEEFVLLAAATDATDAMQTAQAICTELAGLEVEHDESPFGRVTISIGVAVQVPHEHGDPDDLVRRADRALYRAKIRGRNQAMLAAEH
ncbi:diguanylate cyclase [[Empedobacter] haloabium]|uniref:diguanylate cyclase n=1 Tax=[Empedobacter] haloabium TaxID=592317 RepID=A0ABZ1UI20_9BURK